eukprot:TRINITY_DN10595_c0_g1_i1.p1 TRINITY_DN10595_c0_g1~~TRINITY_DN10595_c0_g1_i1.p1  ORF type:complete len:617 (-),score=101.96 TRINITY_DN10595_c0_g1_i1:158-2008(-)
MSEAYFFDNNSDSQAEKDSLAIDDSLSVIDRINKYVNSDRILHKLHLVRELTDLSQQMGYDDTKRTLGPILTKLQQDTEPVIRQTLAEQIPGIAKFILQAGQPADAQEQVFHVLLPMVKSALVDSNPQVRGAASGSLVQIATALEPSQIENHVIPIIKGLASDSREEEHRLAAAELLPKVVPPLPQETQIQLVRSEIPKLAEDPLFRIRKAVAGQLGGICKLIKDPSVTSELLEIFTTLSSDDIWGVRKACVESLVALSECLQSKERVERLLPIFEQFTSDQSRWVKSTAYQNLGPFIATFPPNELPEALLQQFILMVPTEENTKGDSDTTYYAAYNFPAIMVTVGKERWPDLSKTYGLLVKDLQWKVRRTLAYSIHEIAVVIGTEATEHHLVSAFNIFLGDIDQVREGVVKEMATFLSVISAPKRLDYLGVFQDILRDILNWRARKMLARQIGTLAGLYSKEIVQTTFIPIFMQLLQDAVFMVRKTAVKQVGTLIKFVKDDSTLLDELVKLLQAIAKKRSCIDRQVYALVCESLADSIDSACYKSKFLDTFVEFSRDKIPNVRLIVARALSQKLITHAEFGQLQKIKEALELLKKDKDRDVSYNANLPSPPPPKS